jgi:hypothetical protein
VRMPLRLNVEQKKDQMHMVYGVVSDKSRRLIITAGLPPARTPCTHPLHTPLAHTPRTHRIA